jgi:K+-sensing histidine kinase KdpD
MKLIQTATLRRTGAGFLLGCAGLALLTWIGVAFNFSYPATGALLYMLVIVRVSMAGTIAAGIGLAIIATLCLNYFFAEPRFTFQINAVEDLVAVSTFALTAVIITSLVGRALRLGEAAALKDQLQLIIDTAADAVLSRPLKRWAMDVAKRRGLKRAKVALARKLGSVLHRMWVDGTEFRCGKAVKVVA